MSGERQERMAPWTGGWPESDARDAQLDSFLDRQASVEEARAEYDAARTEAVLVGLEMVRKGLGGTMSRRSDGEPSKIASLAAFATLGGTAHVQAQFDRYIEASDKLARIVAGRAV